MKHFNRDRSYITVKFDEDGSERRFTDSSN